MRIIPAIDILNGKCVRLAKGDYATQKIYNEDPVEVAKQFEAGGMKYLHLVDLDGARSKHIVNHKVIKEITTQTNLKVDFGGGLKTNEDLRIAFENGASHVTGGSVAIQNPDLFLEWFRIYGSEKIILGADCKSRKIMTQGWIKESELDVIDFILKYEEKGLRSVICTDVSKDGMLEGPSEELYTEILKNTKINVIASGGVSSLNDLKILKNIGCEAAIVGKAFYEGRITLKELEKLC